MEEISKIIDLLSQINFNILSISPNSSIFENYIYPSITITLTAFITHFLTLKAIKSEKKNQNKLDLINHKTRFLYSALEYYIEITEITDDLYVEIEMLTTDKVLKNRIDLLGNTTNILAKFIKEIRKMKNCVIIAFPNNAQKLEDFDDSEKSFNEISKLIKSKLFMVNADSLTQKEQIDKNVVSLDLEKEFEKFQRKNLIIYNNILNSINEIRLEN